MPTVTIPKLLFQPALQNAIQASFYYKYYLDSSWILIASNVTINTDGTVNSSPLPAFGIDFNKRYTLRAMNEQCETVYEEDIFYPCNQGCPDGYLLSDDGTYCYRITTQPATATGGGTKLTQHYTNAVYSQYGVVIFSPNPGGYNTNGTYIAAPTILNTANFGGVYANTVMANPPVSDITKGRLNACGIWLCGNQNYSATPLGFVRQLNIPTTKQYFIGVGADNYSTITVTQADGSTITINQDPAALALQLTGSSANIDVTFKFWFIYPVTLLAGIATIQIQGTNTGSNGILGCEIYDATLAELSNPAITEDDITGTGGYAIFTTKDTTDCVSPFDVGSYNCDLYPGYSLVQQGSPSEYVCQLITKVNTNCP